MGHQQHAGGLLPVDARENVLHVAADRPFEAARNGVLHFGREARAPSALNESRLDQHVGGATDRMRCFVAEQRRPVRVRAHRGE